MTFDINQAWGYGAVVIPDNLYWQGFGIPDPTPHATAIKRSIDTAYLDYSRLNRVPTDEDVFGAMLSSLVRSVRLNSDSHIAVFAMVVAHLSGHRYFVIDAKEDDKGTTTTLSALGASSARAARDEIEQRVTPLKLGLLMRT